jgi:glycosyltransferase involved in cell wall biosynthesis
LAVKSVIQNRIVESREILIGVIDGNRSSLESFHHCSALDTMRGVGSSSSSSAESEAARSPRVELSSPSDLANAYRDADILLSASWYESFPLFPVEAMACGLSVVTTPNGTEEYAIHGETAEIVAPRSAEDIARGFTRLNRDPSYRCKIAAAGLQISKKFAWDKSVQRFEPILGI